MNYNHFYPQHGFYTHYNHIYLLHHYVRPKSTILARTFTSFGRYITTCGVSAIGIFVLNLTINFGN